VETRPFSFPLLGPGNEASPPDANHQESLNVQNNRAVHRL